MTKSLQSRRDFLRFLGLGATAVSLGHLSSCTSRTRYRSKSSLFSPLGIHREDKMRLAEGFEYRTLLKWQDPINENEQFGDHADFVAWVADKNDTGFLWVNHENFSPLFLHRAPNVEALPRTREAIEKELRQVGGSLLALSRCETPVEIDLKSPHNKRFDAHSKIPFAWNEEIEGRSEAMGTLANCAGGQTPWGTFLSCEENFQLFYGDHAISLGSGPLQRRFNKSLFGWERHFPQNKPEHYGWVVEISPKSGRAKKLVALGRFAHEGATVTRDSQGYPVVYMGDDRSGGCVFKFVSNHKESLEEGELFAADLSQGRWISLSYPSQPALQKAFRNQTEVLTYARDAALLLGATPCDRPEDIAINPHNQDVIIAFTNNARRGNLYGSLGRIREAGHNASARSFQYSVYLDGGSENGFACPDNLAFDPKGNLWFTTDVSGSYLNRFPYRSFGNNSLFVVPSQGDDAGRVLKVASAPVEAELTGPCFSKNGKSLLISVQHPGEKSVSLDELHSRWPHDDDGLPKSALIEISGPAFEKIAAL